MSLSREQARQLAQAEANRTGMIMYVIKICKNRGYDFMTEEAFNDCEKGYKDKILPNC